MYRRRRPPPAALLRPWLTSVLAGAREALPTMTSERPSRCRLCERRPRRGLTEHHLIPRTLHSNKWFKKRFDRERMRATVAVCRDCHAAIHRLIPCEKELGRHHNTVESLKAHPHLARFLRWVRKQK